MTNWPDLTAIEALVAVADHGSLAASARATGMAQPNVSRSIARLERRFGLQLLHRSTTGARLTSQGLVVVEWSRELLAAARHLHEGVAALGVGAETLRLSASHTVAENLVPGWVATIRARHPDLRIQTDVRNSAEVITHLRQGLCDLGFVEGPDAPSGVNHRIVARDELCLIAPPDHPLARRRTPLSLEQVRELPLVTRESGSGTRVTLDRALVRAGLEPVQPVQEAWSNAGVRVAVASGTGLAMLSGLAVHDALAGGSLVRIPYEPVLRRALRAVWLGPATPTGHVADLIAVARRSVAGA